MIDWIILGLLFTGGKVFDFLFNKVLGTVYDIVILPIKVFFKKNERTKFVFESTLRIKEKTTTKNIRALIINNFKLNESNELELEGNIENDKVPFEIKIKINVDFVDLKTPNKKQIEETDVDSITLEFTCHSLLKEVRSNCEFVKKGLDNFKNSLDLFQSKNLLYTHTILKFPLNNTIKFSPIKRLDDVIKTELTIPDGKVIFNLNEVKLITGSWILSEKTENILYKLLALTT